MDVGNNEGEENHGDNEDFHEIFHSCKHCEKTFTSGRALGGHMRSHADLNPKPLLFKPIRSKPSPSQLNYEAPAFSYRSTSLPQNPSDVGLGGVTEKIGLSSVGPEGECKYGKREPGPFEAKSTSFWNPTRQFFCKLCGKGFCTGRALGGHMKSHRTPHPECEKPDSRKVKSKKLDSKNSPPGIVNSCGSDVSVQDVSEAKIEEYEENGDGSWEKGSNEEVDDKELPGLQRVETGMPITVEYGKITESNQVLLQPNQCESEAILSGAEGKDELSVTVKVKDACKAVITSQEMDMADCLVMLSHSSNLDDVHVGNNLTSVNGAYARDNGDDNGCNVVEVGVGDSAHFYFDSNDSSSHGCSDCSETLKRKLVDINGVQKEEQCTKKIQTVEGGEDENTNGCVKNSFPCPICSKVFRSRQALSGHCSTHAKFKLVVEERTQDSCNQAETMNDHCENENAAETDFIRTHFFSFNEKPIVGCTNSVLENETMNHDPEVKILDHEVEQSRENVSGSQTNSQTEKDRECSVVDCVKQSQEQQLEETSTLDLNLIHLKSNSKSEHACSICGKRFSTGQALGGHKRFHWFKKSFKNYSSLSNVHSCNSSRNTYHNVAAINHDDAFKAIQFSSSPAMDLFTDQCSSDQRMDDCTFKKFVLDTDADKTGKISSESGIARETYAENGRVKQKVGESSLIDVNLPCVDSEEEKEGKIPQEAKEKGGPEEKEENVGTADGKGETLEVIEPEEKGKNGDSHNIDGSATLSLKMHNFLDKSCYFPSSTRPFMDAANSLTMTSFTNSISSSPSTMSFLKLQSPVHFTNKKSSFHSTVDSNTDFSSSPSCFLPISSSSSLSFSSNPTFSSFLSSYTAFPPLPPLLSPPLPQATGFQQSQFAVPAIPCASRLSCSSPTVLFPECHHYLHHEQHTSYKGSEAPFSFASIPATHTHCQQHSHDDKCSLSEAINDHTSIITPRISNYLPHAVLSSLGIQEQEHSEHSSAENLPSDPQSECSYDQHQNAVENNCDLNSFNGTNTMAIAQGILGRSLWKKSGIGTSQNIEKNFETLSSISRASDLHWSKCNIIMSGMEAHPSNCS